VPHEGTDARGVAQVRVCAFNSDLYNPGFPVSSASLPGAIALFDSIESTYKLPVSTMTGGHGVGAVTYAVYKTAIGK
jgi:hypothetical protein